LSAPSAGAPRRRTGLILLLGALTAFPALSIDMYLPALPAMARDLGAPLGAAQTTLSLFLAGMAVGQLLYGPLSDRYGRRPPLIAGIALYVLASAACALAPTMEWLWVGRLGQALGGCAGVVIARAAVRDTFDVLESARVYSRLVLVMGAAPILAPLLGGQLLRVADWRAIFWFLGAFGAAALLVVVLRMPETHAGTPRAARPPVVARTFAAILRDPSFLRPAATAAFAQGALFAYLVSSPAVLIEQYGVTPQLFGWFFGANGVGIIAASQLNAHLLRRHPLDRLLRRGLAALALAALATLAVALLDTAGPWGISAAWFALLTSLGFVTANASAKALAGQGARAGSASALLGALQFGVGFGSGSAVAALTAWPAVGTPAHAAGLTIAAFALLAYASSRSPAGRAAPRA
jgi:DHA1 family bicyclomycin/chloramphenicol resistance-like MFS transporter